jgi:FtsH-binding integral membrane protein
MTIPASKLHADIPVAEALPLRDGPKAYAIGYKNYHDVESGGGGGAGGDAMASIVKEATVLESMGWDPETRRAFIRRVYTILAVQLLLTGTVSAFMILHAPTQAYVLGHGWPVSLSIIASIVIIVALMCMKDREPYNMYLLGGFTLVEAFLVGTVNTAYCASGQRGIVLEAVFLTGAIFVGLTIFTCKSKVEFSFIGAFLYMGLGALVVWGFLAMIFGVQTGYVYALLGCIVFSGYILFDTWLIMDKLSPHEHVLAAIMLYLDIINLFLYLLQLLSRNDQN